MIETTGYAANFYSDWFSWGLKRRRLSFLSAVLFGNAFVFGMMFLSQWFFGQWSMMFIISFALLWWVAYMVIASQRLRDMQVSQWWLAGFFILQVGYVALPFGSLPAFLSVCLLATWPTGSEVEA
mgnify:CR=1 FL=1|jgi:uncharacterized membrane protein YhaH (DUF805 family)